MKRDQAKVAAKRAERANRKESAAARLGGLSIEIQEFSIKADDSGTVRSSSPIQTHVLKPSG